LRLMVVSHACVLPVNQSFYADVEAATGWGLSLILPAEWRNEYSDRIVPRRLETLTGSLSQIPVWKRGNIPLHVYKSWFGKLLRKINPDAIYVHHEPYGLATAQVYLANKRYRDVPIGFYAAQNISKRYPWPIARLEQWILSKSSFCFPVTEGALSVLRGKGYAGRAKVLPLAVDRQLYFPHTAAGMELRSSLDIAEDVFVIGFMGRLVKEKGLLTLVKALERMKQFSWVSIIVGAGENEGEIRQEIDRLGLADRIKFVGYVPHSDGPKWLSLFDVLVLVSESTAQWKEQFGRVLVEANACGTAVIGSECGEIPAVIGRTGGGVVVPEADAESLSKALVDLLQNPEKRRGLSEHGRMVVEREYDQAHLASEFAALIEQSVEQAAH
jgi:glycosyltransferase involved in cell wall biosynthesis